MGAVSLGAAAQINLHLNIKRFECMDCHFGAVIKNNVNW